MLHTLKDTYMYIYIPDIERTIIYHDENIHVGQSVDEKESLSPRKRTFKINSEEDKVVFQYIFIVDFGSGQVRVECVYEPPQENFPQGFEVSEDLREDAVETLAGLLGLKKVCRSLFFFFFFPFFLFLFPLSSGDMVRPEVAGGDGQNPRGGGFF